MLAGGGTVTVRETGEPAETGSGSDEITGTTAPSVEVRNEKLKNARCAATLAGAADLAIL